MNLSNFDSLSQDRKIALLKESLTLEDISSAKLISRKMGCSITTEKGFKKVLPLLDRTESSFYRNKIVSWGLFKEKSIISEFGEVNGLEALGRATLGNLTVHNAFFDLGLPKLIPKNKTFTSLDSLRTALFSKAGDVFDLIYSNGVGYLKTNEGILRSTTQKAKNIGDS